MEGAQAEGLDIVGGHVVRKRDLMYPMLMSKMVRVRTGIIMKLWRTAVSRSWRHVYAAC